MTASPGPGTGPVSGHASASEPHGRSAPAGDLGDLRHDVEDTVDVAMERGRGFAQALRGHALGIAEDRKVEAARSVTGLAQSLRDSGRNFEGQPNVQAFFQNAADGLDDLAGSIERRSLDDFYREAAAYARRSPVAVAAATFAAGFLVSRFVKASTDAAAARADAVRAESGGLPRASASDLTDRLRG